MPLRKTSEQDAWFDALVEQHRRALVGFLFRLVHEQIAAERLAQETLVRLYRFRHDFSSAARVGLWLYRTAASLAIERGETPPADQPRAARYISDLPVRQRVAVLLLKYQGLDCEQVAEVLGTSASETRILLFEAYVTLRGKLSGPDVFQKDKA